MHFCVVDSWEDWKMTAWKYARLTSLLICCGLFFIGCSSSDENNPANPGGTPTLTLSGEEAEDFSTSALTMVNQIVDIIPQFAEGDFDTWAAAKTQDQEIHWDPQQEAYVFNFNGPILELEPPSYWTMSLSIWLQYRDALENPLESPLGAVSFEMDYTTGMAMHMQEGQEYSDLEYLMATNVTVSYQGEGGYGIVGTGSTVVEVEQETAQMSESGQFTMDWTLDISTSASGCPSGTASVHCQDFTMGAVYDGEGGVAWTLVGNNYQASGNEYVGCGQPVN
jgi:hypothetical protein